MQRTMSLSPQDWRTFAGRMALEIAEFTQDHQLDKDDGDGPHLLPAIIRIK